MHVVKKVFFIALMIWMLYFINSYATTGTITTEGARIRREANTSSDVITIVYNAETVEIIEKEGQWYKVKYGESIGYIREDLMNVDGEVTNPTETQEEQEQKPSDVQTAQQEDSPAEQEPSQEQTSQETNKEGEKQIVADTAMRIIPSLSASIIGELKAGAKVTVIQTMNAWSCIRFENKTAWVVSSFLTEVSEEKQPEQPETKIGYVNVSGAIIRRGPSTSAEIITEWGKNKPVEIVAEEGDWYKINFEGEEAYVAKRLISDNITPTSRGMQAVRELPDEPVVQEKVADNNENVTQPNVSVATQDTVATPSVETNSTSGEAVVAYAKQYLGCSYVYGGVGPRSFDCSGFTQYVYKQFGISLAHSAVTQSNNGSYVAKSDLQPGDLVIFRDWNNNSIGHCGIYIGGGNFIHAANSTRGVVTDTLNSGYYYERYVSGRRLF
ncbi:MAG: SH3 domain-containing protein [Clostridia bacterium]